ncbi:MAG: zinc finger AN1 domain-containing stress-associated protein [Candidatus Bathyarchaeia archaeon]
MSNTIFFVVLEGLLWNNIVSKLNLSERSENIGDGVTEEGYRFSLIKRGNNIYLILPDYPEDECEEVARRIVETLVGQMATVQVFGYYSAFCNYCLAQTSLPFKCRRCGGWYCNEHRLPEMHNCPGSSLSRIIAQKIYKQKSVEDKKAVLISKSPCG